MARRRESGTSRRAVLAALLAAALLPMVAPTSSEGRALAVQKVAATTIVRGEGHTGAILSVPNEATLTEDNFNVKLLKGATYAYVGLADTAPDACGRDRDDFFAMCLRHEIYMLRLPKSAIFKREGFKLVSDPPTVRKGIHELYILSDGPVKVTLKFAGLGSGTVRLRATGSVKAISKRIPARCPDAFGDCAEFGYGGLTRTVSGPAFASVLAHAYLPSEWVPGTGIPYPGTHGVAACINPQWGSEGGSPDPDDHPYGCDFLPTEGAGEDWLGDLVFFGTRSAQVIGGSTTVVAMNVAPDGPVYAGFTAQQRSTLGTPGKYVAYGFWLEEGITPTRR